MRAREQAAKILVAVPRGGQHGQDRLGLSMVNSAPTIGLTPSPRAGAEKARRPVNAVAIAQGEGRDVQGGGALHQRLGLRGAAQKTEGAAGVEFDVAHC